MRKMFCILLMFVSLLILTACGSNMIGKYKLVEMADGEVTYDSKYLDSLGIEYWLEIKDEKNAIISAGSEKVDLTYDDKSFTGKDIKTGEITSLSYTKDGNKIIIIEEKTKMTFEKNK